MRPSTPEVVGGRSPWPPSPPQCSRSGVSGKIWGWRLGGNFSGRLVAQAAGFAGVAGAQEQPAASSALFVPRMTPSFC